MCKKKMGHHYNLLIPFFNRSSMIAPSLIPYFNFFFKLIVKITLSIIMDRLLIMFIGFFISPIFSRISNSIVHKKRIITFIYCLTHTSIYDSYESFYRWDWIVNIFSEWWIFNYYEMQKRSINRQKKNNTCTMCKI